MQEPGNILSSALSIGNQVASIFVGIEKIVDSIISISDKVRRRTIMNHLEIVFKQVAHLGVIRADFKQNLISCLSAIEKGSISKEEFYRRWSITKCEADDIVLAIERIRPNVNIVAEARPELGVKLVELLAIMTTLYSSISAADAPSSLAEIVQLRKAAEEIKRFTDECVDIAERIHDAKVKT